MTTLPAVNPDDLAGCPVELVERGSLKMAFLKGQSTAIATGDTWLKVLSELEFASMGLWAKNRDWSIVDFDMLDENGSSVSGTNTWADLSNWWRIHRNNPN